MADDEALTAEHLNMACFEMSRQLDGIEWAVPEAAPLVRRLLRMAGRVIIDVGGASGSAEAWPNTETTVLQWLRETLAPLGYDVTPRPGSGRAPVPDPADDW